MVMASFKNSEGQVWPPSICSVFLKKTRSFLQWLKNNCKLVSIKKSNRYYFSPAVGMRWPGLKSNLKLDSWGYQKIIV